VLFATSLVVAYVALVAAPFFSYISFDLPGAEELEVLLDPQTGELLQPTRLYDRNGQTILFTLEPPSAPRGFIAASDNPFLATAFIASTDPGFLDHGGFLWAINQRPTTLAERLVANLLLADEPDGWLKNLRTRMLAGFATSRYGQQQILTWALNSATFGHWTFGVESAAQLYFGKPAADLSLAESALLAAVAQAPALNPFDAPELSIEYQRLVLVAMHEQGMISDSQFATALTEPLEFAPAPAETGQVTDFADFVISQLEVELGQTQIQRGALEVITTLDVTLQREIEAGAPADIETVVLNPSNGQVLALLGQARATHPAERMLYPFLYLSAFAQGRSPASLIWDLPEAEQSNPDLYHGPVSMREALANSYSGAAASIKEDLGAVDSILTNFGFSGETYSVLDFATAYSVFADGGFGETLGQTAILFVHDGERLLLDRSQTQATSIISPELAFLVTDVLGDASVRSTGSLTNVNFERPTAIQIEETEVGSWFVAYSPQRLVTTWEARPPSDLGPAIFEAAHRDLPIQNWHVPAGLSSAIVCVPSGQLPDADCPATRREFFLSGNLPNTTDTLYQRIAINALTNTLATVFTHTEFVEESLYFQIPEDAQDWARAAGIPSVPSDYDSFPTVELDAPLIILNPKPFDFVSGTVNIFGRLPAEASSYDIQIGSGLYPSEWVLVAEGNRIPRSGALARWDTTGLSGLYAIQMQVWDQEGNLSRGYSLVTVTN
jgi:membrane peptidoglycan carboxypeptidase